MEAAEYGAHLSGFSPSAARYITRVGQVESLIGICPVCGRPNFNLLQNFRTGARHIRYFAFDLLCLNNRDTTKLRLIERRNLFKTLSFKDRRIKIIDYIEAEPDELPGAVREQKLEGKVGKRKVAYTNSAHAVERGSNTV